MKKRIFAAVMLMLMVVSVTYSCFAVNAGNVNEQVADEVPVVEEPIVGEPVVGEPVVEAPIDDTIIIKNITYDDEEETLTVVLANNSDKNVWALFAIESYDKSEIAFSGIANIYGIPIEQFEEFIAGTEKTIIYSTKIYNYEKGEKLPVVNAFVQYEFKQGDVIDYTNKDSIGNKEIVLEDILNAEYDVEDEEEIAPPTAGEAVMNFLKQTGFAMVADNWKSLIMILIACILLYLGIVKQFEPLLLVPIAFGMLLTNLPGAGMFHESFFAGGHVHWDKFAGVGGETPGLIDILYLGVKLGVYPCLIFIGVGAMTDFGPLIANPKSLLLGAAAQLGIFVTYLAAKEVFDFSAAEAASTGIIGGADGPTAIFVTSKLAPGLLGPIAVAAYSYMALVPVIQPPIMKLLTTKKERQIVMTPLRQVSKAEKIIFPIVVTVFVSLLVPSAGPLVGCLMLGNLFKECGVTERLSKTVQNELMNIVTVFLGISVGATATGDTFLAPKTIQIIAMGIVAFGLGTAGGVLLAKFMNLFLKTKINPLIGSAGVSAVPMAARVSQTVGQKENPKNFLLMHAMGPNVAGVIGSAIAAGVLLALFG